jgi:hypothetical protein
MSPVSGSATSSPPLATLTATSPCGSAALTAAASTRSGRCTPIVTSTRILRASSPSVRKRVNELWWSASSTARRAALV